MESDQDQSCLCPHCLTKRLKTFQPKTFVVIGALRFKMIIMKFFTLIHLALHTGPRSAVGNVSGYRCVSDCRSRAREFDPGPVPYFRGD